MGAGLPQARAPAAAEPGTARPALGPGPGAAARPAVGAATSAAPCPAPWPGPGAARTGLGTGSARDRTQASGAVGAGARRTAANQATQPRRPRRPWRRDRFLARPLSRARWDDWPVTEPGSGGSAAGQETAEAMEARVRASFGRQAMMATLGARLAVGVAARVERVGDHDERFTPQDGFLHGGLFAAVLDSA